MRASRQSLAAVGLVLAIFPALASEPADERGAALLAPFKQQLQQALREGLAAGPVEAISACQIRAPEIRESLSQEGVRLGRSSHRLRNPRNAPPDWVAPVLNDYVARAEDREARVVKLEDGRTGYAEPILVAPLCTTCHGTVLAPEVGARIRELYPEDRAVGFQPGDLRGVFWVEYPSGE